VASHLAPADGWKTSRAQKTNYQVQMSSRETLVAMVESVLREGFQQLDGGDGDDKHADASENSLNDNGNQGTDGPPRWVMTFDGQPYTYQGSITEEERALNIRFRSELVDARTGTAPSLENMVWKLKACVHGIVQSEAGVFEFRLARLSAVKAADQDSLVPFSIEPVEPSFSGKLERDFLDLKTIHRADGFRSVSDAYYRSKNAWMQADSGKYEKCLPTRPPWTTQEIELLALLFCGSNPKKFHKTWLTISRFGLLHHSQGEAIEQWDKFEMGQEDGLIELIHDQYSTKSARIVAAKRLAVLLVNQALAQGAPQPQPEPQSSSDHKRQRLD